MNRARATVVHRIPVGGRLGVCVRIRACVRSSVGVVCAALAAGGCSPQSSTGEVRSPIVMDTFVSDLAAAMCGWQFRCCALPEIEGDGASNYLTESDCRTVLTRTIAEKLSEARIGLETKHLSFDSSVAASCLQQFTQGACNAMPDLRPGLPPSPNSLLAWDRYASCPNPFLGQLPTGSECFLRTECATGQSCTSGGDPGWTLTEGGLRAPFQLGDNVSDVRGHCQPDGQPGTPCSSSAECAPELYCRVADSVCARPAGEGKACQSSTDASQNPTFPVACADSPRALVCGGGHCHRLPQVGEPCLEGASQPCDLSTDPSIVCVGAGLNGAGVCQKPGQMGDACVVGSQTSPSAVAPCAGSLACMGDATASPAVGHCAPPIVAGQTCSLDLRCAAPALCYVMQSIGKGLCVLPGKIRDGGACQSDLDCTSLLCGIDSSGSGTCIPGGQPLCAGPYNYVAQAANVSGSGAAGFSVGGGAVTVHVMQ